MEELAALAEGTSPPEPPSATEVGAEPVDDAAPAETAATARELAACANAGDFLRRFALFSDGHLRVAYPDAPTRVLETIAENPPPLPVAQRAAPMAVDACGSLEDGRISARMRVDNPATHSHDANVAALASQEEAARLIFVEENGRWRVDESRGEDARTDATPVAGTAGP